jgi:hypothetical protein
MLYLLLIIKEPETAFLLASLIDPDDRPIEYEGAVVRLRLDCLPVALGCARERAVGLGSGACTALGWG